MTELLQKKWAQLPASSVMLSKVKGRRLSALLGVIALIVTGIVVLALWLGNSEYRPLYGRNETFDQSQVMSVLDKQGFSFYVDGNNGQLMVVRDQLGKARMALAAAGVKVQLPTGLEILEKDNSLGTSQFIEDARYRHGLEGELARTIMSLDSITNARVHLAIPKRTLFIRGNPELPSASIAVSLQPGTTLNPGQVRAIVNLVSGSVTDLKPENITVVDQAGHLLSVNDADAQAGETNTQYLEYVNRLERSYIDRATRMLDPMLGMGNFEVQVAAKVNFDRKEATEEVYNPQGVLTREFSREDRSNKEQSAGVPGALSNQPADKQADKPANNNNKTKNTATTPERNSSSSNDFVNHTTELNRDFQLDKTQRHIRYQQGELQHLSVSVLINGKPDRYSKTELEQMTTMLQDALGLRDADGDQISLHVVPFVASANPLSDDVAPWWKDPFWIDVLRYVLAAVVILAVLFGVVRPILRQLAKPLPISDSALPTRLDDENITDGELQSEDDKQNTDGSTALVPRPSLTLNESLLELPSPETGLEVQLERIQLLVNQEPERVAQVVKQWIKVEQHDGN
ncbi:MAG: flagellar basal-body MS-ring/collar protein FliF [Plesiomonas sp.]|uniref:flagellar basal-body MS-ring/collar protein FliF n=1 Tax=Plesiomonas sp. TaxID=2486279 RepID=UPI003F3E1319